MKKHEITLEDAVRIAKAGKRYALVDDGKKLLFTTFEIKKDTFAPFETTFNFTLLSLLFGPQTDPIIVLGERNKFEADKECLYINGFKIIFLDGSYTKLPIDF